MARPNDIRNYARLANQIFSGLRDRFHSLEPIVPSVFARSLLGKNDELLLTADSFDESGRIKAQYLSTSNRVFYVPLIFNGDLIEEQIFGYWKAGFSVSIIGVQTSLQNACTGSAGSMDLVNGSNIEQSRVVSFSVGDKTQESIFETPLSISAGGVIKGKIKSIGSDDPGSGLVANLIIQSA